MLKSEESFLDLIFLLLEVSNLSLLLLDVLAYLEHIWIILSPFLCRFSHFSLFLEDYKPGVLDLLFNPMDHFLSLHFLFEMLLDFLLQLLQF